MSGLVLDLTKAIEARLSNYGKDVDPARRFDKMVDPTENLDGMPPNMGNFMLPHVGSFVGLVSSQSKVYRPSDEALKQSQENARFMRNDTGVMECVEMRQRACALLDWHLEPEDPKDKDQIALAAEMTKILERIPRFMQYRENLLNATWYGRYGVQNRWRWKNIGGKMRLSIDSWLPVHGDKIVWRYDDGRRTHMPDQIGIRVGAGFQFGGWRKEQLDKLSKVEPTDYGMAYFLDSWERPLLSVHKHFIEDGEWEEPRNAGRIHGHGIRSRIYWVWFQKQEALAMLMEFLERSAAGFDIWFYPQGNPQAKNEVKKAALDRSELGHNTVLVPRIVGDEMAGSEYQRIEPSMAGAAEMKSIISDYFGHQIKRYILGQTLTTEADATGLGSGLADVHLETFMAIIRYDATLLEETITEEVVEPIKRFNFPEASNIRLTFRIDTEQPDSQAKMEAFQMAFGMGLPLRAQELRDLIGAAAPDADDEVLSQIELMKQQADIQQAAAPPAGPMGGVPGDGDGDGVSGEGDEPSPVKMSAAAHVAMLPGALSARAGEGDRSVLEPADGPRIEQYRSFTKRAHYVMPRKKSG